MIGRFALDGGFLLDGGAELVPSPVPYNDGFRRAALQADDKLLVLGGGAVGGNFSVAYVGRFTLDARFDPSFNGGAYFKRQVAFQSSFGMSYNDVAVDAFGRIVVVGYIDPNGWNVIRIWP